jgi:hypothetical protein
VKERISMVDLFKSIRVKWSRFDWRPRPSPIRDRDGDANRYGHEPK